MSLRGYITVEAEVAVSDLVDHLDDADIDQLYNEQGDGKAAADYAHRLCMDLAVVPVLRPLAVGPAPWAQERAA